MKSPVHYKRAAILEERINAGKSLEGMTGYVPCEANCCQGSTEIYVPVTVVGIKLGDCEFSVVVALLDQALVCYKAQFTINPKNFFNTTQEIADWEAHRKRRAAYRLSMKPWDYSASTLTRQRSLFRMALEETADELRTEILEELGEQFEIKSASNSLLKPWYEKMMVAKHFPGYPTAYDPDTGTEDDE